MPLPPVVDRVLRRARPDIEPEPKPLGRAHNGSEPDMAEMLGLSALGPQLEFTEPMLPAALYAAPQKTYCEGCPMSTNKVDGLIDTVEGIVERVGQRAEDVAKSLLAREQGINDHLDAFDAVDSKFAEVEQKLAGFLKGFTNGPRVDEKKDG